MTVPVQQGFLAVPGELQLEAALLLAQQELLEQEALAGHRARLVAAEQIDRLVAEREQARRLEPDDRHAASRIRQQPVDVPARVLASFRQHALRDHRTAAALLVDQLHAIAGGLEQLHRRAADLRTVVVDERVVEEHHVTALARAPRRSAREPRAQRLGRQRRQRPAPIDAGESLEQPATHAEVRHEVRQRGRPRAETVQRLDRSEEPIPEREPVRLIVVVQELVLQLRHVDVRRALGLATLAFEAEVHHLVEPLAGELRRRRAAREHGAQRVGTPARRRFLVARRQVRGAHRAFERLAAHADAVAHLDRRGEAALVREVEQRLRLPGLVARAVAKVRQDVVPSDDVARVHPVLGVERLFQLAKRLEDGRPVHALEERAPRPAVAVLARDRATVLQHQVGDLVGDRPHLLEPPLGLEIDHRTDVQAADRAMPVTCALDVVLAHDVAEARHELGNVLRIHGGVLDERDRLLVALHPEQEAESRLPELPDRLLLPGFERDVRRVAEAFPRSSSFQLLHLRAHFVRGVTRVFHHQDRARIALHERGRSGSRRARSPSVAAPGASSPRRSSRTYLPSRPRAAPC